MRADEEEEELGKFACLAVREVLVLTICLTIGPMSDLQFEQAIEGAFGRPLGPELRSQLHLSRSAVCRLGQNPEVCARALPKIFSSTLQPDEMNAAFQEYQRCSNYVMMAERTPRRERLYRLRRTPSLPPMRSTTKEAGTQTDATPIIFEARAAQAAAAQPDGHSKACVICWNANPDTALVPCGHLQTCYACSCYVHQCPICRKKIKTRLKIYQD